jgi:hypothetical protein
MDNYTAIAHGEELSQYLLQAIHKLVHAGAFHQRISITLGLKLEVVQQVHANYPRILPVKPTTQSRTALKHIVQCQVSVSCIDQRSQRSVGRRVLTTPKTSRTTTT